METFTIPESSLSNHFLFWMHLKYDFNIPWKIGEIDQCHTNKNRFFFCFLWLWSCRKLHLIFHSHDLHTKGKQFWARTKHLWLLWMASKKSWSNKHPYLWKLFSLNSNSAWSKVLWIFLCVYFQMFWFTNEALPIRSLLFSSLSSLVVQADTLGY